MVMMVMVDAERRGGLGAEQPHVFGMARHGVGYAGATDVAVETDHPVALCHHDVQVVADQQHADAALLSQPADQRVELGLADVIDTAHRLVEHQQMRLAQQRSGEEHTLQLAARKRIDLLARRSAGPDVVERTPHVRLARALAEREEAHHAQRDRRLYVEALRHVADDEARGARDAPRVRLFQPEQQPHQRRLAGTVGTDQRQDLACPDVEVDRFQDDALAARHADIPCGDQDPVERWDDLGQPDMLVPVVVMGMGVALAPGIRFGIRGCGYSLLHDAPAFTRNARTAPSPRRSTRRHGSRHWPLHALWRSARLHPRPPRRDRISSS